MLNAKFVDFAGFQMPIQYQGIILEHNYVRNSVGIFDVSHMGQFKISGSNAKDFIQKITSNDINKLTPGKAQYSLLINFDGKIVDDLIIYHLDDYYLMVVNASNIEKNESWILGQIDQGVIFENLSDEMGLIAVQGPKSRSVLQNLFPEILNLNFYENTLMKNQVFIARTGYTGELGFEIYAFNHRLNEIWDNLLSIDGVHPVGLGCRDSLRLEMGYCLYGNEISENENPYEAGLGWVTKTSTNFIGANKLIDCLPSKKLIALTMVDRGIPRKGYKIFSASSKEEIGYVTSGVFSPSLQKGICLAYVESSFSKEKDFFISIRDNYLRLIRNSLPFFKEGTLYS
jgi:aminomethyltransferase